MDARPFTSWALSAWRRPHVYPVMHRLLLVGAGLLTAACSSPSTPTPTTPPGGGGSPTGGLYDVTLEVFEDAPPGFRPIAGARGTIDFRRPGDNFSTGNGFQTDDDGRYVFPHMAHGTAVKIRADQGGYYQPCAVGASITSASTLRLELVKAGSQPRILASPVLSGMVYTNGPLGREPVADLAIGYMSGCRGLVEVYGRTDEQGRYLFCRLPPGPGCLLMYWGWDSEFEKQVPLNIGSGDLVVDVDLSK